MASASSARGTSTSSRAPEIEIARWCALPSPPPMTVRLKIHCTGLSTMAVKGSSITGRSYQTCTFTIGEAPRPGSSAIAAGETATTRWGGRASTTASVGRVVPSASVTPPGPASSTAVPVTTRPPRAARKSRAAGSTRRVSPTRDQPIAEASRVARNPRRKTNAPSAADTRSLRSLQVGSTIRSQNRRTAPGDWPRPASQSANVTSSSRRRARSVIAASAPSARRAAAFSPAERCG